MSITGRIDFDCKVSPQTANVEPGKRKCAAPYDGSMPCLRSHALQTLLIPSAEDKAQALLNWPQTLALGVEGRWPEPQGLPGRSERPRLLPPPNRYPCAAWEACWDEPD